MKIPWKTRSELIEEKKVLENRITELEQELEKKAQRFEAERERRKKLSREKQEAQEELNRLEDRIESDDRSIEDSDNEEKDAVFRDISFRELYHGLDKISSMSSEAEELVTVYSSKDLRDHPSSRTVKNSVEKRKYDRLASESQIIIFHDSDLFTLVYRLRPFYDDKVAVDDGFDVKGLLDFIEKEKKWVLVSRGRTRILEEKAGKIKDREEIKDRVDRKHSKGGYSQDRFERKRDEQIENHLEGVREEIRDLDDLYILGDQSICKDLPGEYLGGFDENMSEPEKLYQPRKLEDWSGGSGR